MTTFDFITDDGFRESLESDHRELGDCLKAQCWKAVLVLAGSIVEAILVDALMSSDWPGNNPDQDPLQMDLAKLTDVCRKEKIISRRASDLSSVVRSYRNLIHPGRALRLNDKPTEADASIASSLIAIISREVAERRRSTYGLTGAQLLSKIEKDSSVGAILPNLLMEVNQAESSRLLLSILPERYFELLGYQDDPFADEPDIASVLSRLAHCYRAVFDKGSDSLKKKAVERYVEVLKQGGESEVNMYTERFFNGWDLEYATPNDRDLIIKHVLSRLNAGFDPRIIEIVKGVEPHLSAEDVPQWIDPLLRYMLSHTISEESTNDMRLYVLLGATRLKDKTRGALAGRMKEWMFGLETRSNEGGTEFVKELEKELEEDLPF